MKRYLVLSFDDGPKEDIRFVELLNKYNIPATLNLNSGLEDFVWYYENKTPIERIKFNENLHLYDNHEIASHTVNHPCLTNLSEDELIHQVKDDVISLENTFGREITSFAVPFTACGEREIDIILRRYGLVDGHTMTLQNISDIYSITRERVRQIENKALRKLRHPNRSKRLKEYIEV